MWSNPNPNNNFSAQTINNLPDISKYNYIVIAYKGVNNREDFLYYQKFKILNYSSTSTRDMTLFVNGVINTSGGVLRAISRFCRFTSSTSIEIGDCYFTINANEGRISNDQLIPMKIIGTNIL